MPSATKSIVPELFEKFRKYKINILFLPEYRSDKNYAAGFDNVYMPEKPLNGLDVCYYSKAVLTGAGTFAREAAIIGTPAVSFFPKDDLLSVDKKMMENNLMLHSRNPEEILHYIFSSRKREFENSSCKKIQNSVFKMVENILKTIN